MEEVRRLCCISTAFLDYLGKQVVPECTSAVEEASGPVHVSASQVEQGRLTFHRHLHLAALALGCKLHTSPPLLSTSPPPVISRLWGRQENWSEFIGRSMGRKHRAEERNGKDGSSSSRTGTFNKVTELQF